MKRLGLLVLGLFVFGFIFSGLLFADDQMATETPWADTQWPGKTKDDLLKYLGQPTLTFSDGNGGEIYRYEEDYARTGNFNHENEDFDVASNGTITSFSESMVSAMGAHS